jgi:hypothetical protein
MTLNHRASTPPEDLTVEAQGVPDDPVALASGWLACLSCGQAVLRNAAAETTPAGAPIVLETYGRHGAQPTARPHSAEVVLTRCQVCADRLQMAERVVDSRPRLAARFGPDNAVHRLSCALDGLAALGYDPATATKTAVVPGEAEVLALIRHLTVPGAQSRWASRLVPFLAADADLRTCSPSAWAHVKLGQRRELRTGYAALLAERVARNAPPINLAPPPVPATEVYLGQRLVTPAACLFCGIGQQSVPAVEVEQAGGRIAAAQQVWTRHTITPGQMGGALSPEALVGHLCRVCAAAVRHVGSIGPDALERALVAHLAPQQIGMLGYDNLRVPGLVGWAVLAVTRQAPPNTRPWEHLRDLAAVSEQLGAMLG